MKKLAISLFMAISLLTGLASYCSAQSITIAGYAPVLDIYGNEITDGAGIFVMRLAPSKGSTGTPDAPSFNFPWLDAPSGDSLISTGTDNNLYTSSGGWVKWANPLVYMSTPFQYASEIEGFGIPVDTSDMGLNEGEKFYVYLRIIPKIAGMTYTDPYSVFPDKGFDSNGVWTNELIGNGKFDQLNIDGVNYDGLYYYDSPLYELIVGDDAVTIMTIGGVDGDGNPINSPTAVDFAPYAKAVPEPAMFVFMITGLAWIFARVKRI